MSKYIFSYPVGIKETVHIKARVNKFVGLDDMPVDASLSLVRVQDHEDIPSELVFNKDGDGSDVAEFWAFISERAKARYGKNWRHHLDAYAFFCRKEEKEGNYFFSFGPKAIKAGTHSLFLGRKGSSPRIEIKSNVKLQAKSKFAPRWRG